MVHSWASFDTDDEWEEDMLRTREAEKRKAAPPPENETPEVSPAQAAAAATVLQTPLQVGRPLTFRKAGP